MSVRATTHGAARKPGTATPHPAPHPAAFQRPRDPVGRRVARADRTWRVALPRGGGEAPREHGVAAPREDAPADGAETLQHHARRRRGGRAEEELARARGEGRGRVDRLRECVEARVGAAVFIAARSSGSAGARRSGIASVKVRDVVAGSKGSASATARRTAPSASRSGAAIASARGVSAIARPERTRRGRRSAAQAGEVVAHRRLGDAEAPRGPRDVALAEERVEGGEEREIIDRDHGREDRYHRFQTHGRSGRHIGWPRRATGG